MTRIALALLLLAAVPVMPQGPAPATFRSTVTVVNVPVVVRDVNGHAVGNLTKGSFRLYDRGKQQTITTFILETAATPAVDRPAAGTVSTTGNPPPQPEIPASVIPNRFVAYLFDDVHSSPGDLILARNAALRHMKGMADAKVRAAIFTMSGQTMLEFTDDREKWDAALAKLSTHPIMQPSKMECPSLTYFWADLIRNHNDAEATFYATQVATVCSGGSGSITGYNPTVTTVGRGSKTATSATSVGASDLVRGAVARTLALQMQDTTASLDTLRNLIQRLSSLPGERSIVLASPGFLTLIDDKYDESLVIERAVAAKVVINSLDIRGLAAEVPDIEKSRGLGPPALIYSQGKDHEIFMAQPDVMAELSSGTGGTFFHNSNDLDAGFNRVAATPEYRYILGFSPSGLKLDGATHSLKVSVSPNPHHYEVEARRSYAAPNHYEDPMVAARRAIRDALFSRDEIAEVPFDLRSESLVPPSDQGNFAAIARIEASALRLHKTGDRNRDGLLMVSAGVFDTDGNYESGISRGIGLKSVPDETFEEWIRSGIVVRCDLPVKAGKHLLRVVVVVSDSSGQRISTRNSAVDLQ